MGAPGHGHPCGGVLLDPVDEQVDGGLAERWVGGLDVLVEVIGEQLGRVVVVRDNFI